MFKRGAKAVRHRVRCTLCDESFDSDYAGKHTQKWHKNLADKGQIATTIPVGAKIVRDPWSAAAECVSTKRPRIDLDDAEEEDAPEVAESTASNDTLQQKPEQEEKDTPHSDEDTENEDPGGFIPGNEDGLSESESESDGDEDPAGLSVDKESKECLGKCLYAAIFKRSSPPNLKVSRARLSEGQILKFYYLIHMGLWVLTIIAKISFRSD